MDEFKGYVKVYRRLLSSQIWSLIQPYCWRAAWVDMLLHASFKAGNTAYGGHPAGSLILPVAKVAARWNWDEGKFFTFLGFLENNGMIKTQQCSFGGRQAVQVQLCNWAAYQGCLQDEKKRSKRKEELEECNYILRDTTTSCNSTKNITDNNLETNIEECKVKFDINEMTPAFRLAYQKWKENGKNENQKT